MKILFVGGNALDSSFGGDTTVIKELNSQLATHQEIWHICVHPQYWNAVSWLGIFSNTSQERNIIYEKPNLSLLSKVIRNIFSSFKSVNKYSKGIKITLTHTIYHSYNKAFFEHALQRIAPDIVHLHGFSLPLLPYYEVLFERRDLSLIATGHSVLKREPEVERFYDPLIEQDLAKEIVKRGTLTVVSKGVKDIFSEDYGILPEEILLIRNGVDPEKFKPHLNTQSLRIKYKIADDKIIFLSVGQVHRRKNQTDVIRAIAQLDKETKERILYIVVGDGPDLSTCNDLCKDLGLVEICKCYGRVSEVVLTELYALSDFFILTPTSEAFGLVFLEAMSAGLPVITYRDLEGISDIYDPSCMLLTESRDIASISKAIVSATTRSWDRQKIREHAMSFDWSDIANQYLSAYGLTINGILRT